MLKGFVEKPMKLFGVFSKDMRKIFPFAKFFFLCLIGLVGYDYFLRKFSRIFAIFFARSGSLAASSRKATNSFILCLSVACALADCPGRFLTGPSLYFGAAKIKWPVQA